MRPRLLNLLCDVLIDHMAGHLLYTGNSTSVHIAIKLQQFSVLLRDVQAS